MAPAVSTLERQTARDAHRPADPTTTLPETLVIVGNGMVGHRLCRSLVSRGAAARYRIVVFGDEPVPAYDRVHLTELFEGREERDLCLAPTEWYADHGIDLRLDDAVVQIDREARRVRTSSGAEVDYDRLVLATGSAPYVPPIEGADLSRVFVYRALRDLHAIRDAARTARTAAVIGGGLLGLEAARALGRQGVRVTVIETARALMPSQLDQDSGAELGRQVAAGGVDLLTGTLTRRIVASGAQRTLQFAGGDSRTVDLVVMAAGVRPRTELAAACDLTRAPDGGVIVNDTLGTSDPRIFAIGECASHRSQTYGVVAPGFAMADALADTLTGTITRFAGAQPTIRLKLLDINVVTAGEALEGGSALRFTADGISRLIRVERGRIVGALGVGDWEEFSEVQQAAAARRRIWPWQSVRFTRTGRLWREQQDPPVTAWEPHAVVCNCMNVTRGQIAAACAAGAVTADDISARTGASTLCGSCRPLLLELAVAGPPVPRPVAFGLLTGSVLAIALAVAVLIAPPVAFSAAMQPELPIDTLWRNATVRQATGFTLVGLTGLAALLGLRKRWGRASAWGRFPVWRLAHAGLGLLTLVMLVVHTGARLGDNLNFALMGTFTVVNVLGGLAGGLTALEGRLGTRRWRRGRGASVAAHLLVIWPLPLLVVFHVLAVYYF